VVALLFYACAQGVRSSRGIERKCREDVAFMVITAMRVPDHSTIAEFRKRHEVALAALFTDVLGLCEKAGLVKVGVIAIDGTKISANASMGANRSYGRIARELLDEVDETDRREDEVYREARGDELPEQLCTHEGRRQLDVLRERHARPIARSRTERLQESKRRLEEEHQVELESNAAYETYRATARDSRGRRLGHRPDPYSRRRCRPETRAKSPISAISPSAVSVAIPRNRVRISTCPPQRSLPAIPPRRASSVSS
jgi:Transposase domain (DUF772)